MHLQTAYNLMRAGLLAQGERAQAHGVCKYRTPEGLRCAIGHLIPMPVTELPFHPPEAMASFDPDPIPIEGIQCGARTLLNDYPKLANWFDIIDLSQESEDLNLLIAMQNIHD